MTISDTKSEGFPHSDTPGSKLAWQLPEAFRSLLRPSSLIRVKASTAYVSNLLLLFRFVRKFPINRTLTDDRLTTENFRFPSSLLLSRHLSRFHLITVFALTSPASFPWTVSAKIGVRIGIPEYSIMKVRLRGNGDRGSILSPSSPHKKKRNALSTGKFHDRQSQRTCQVPPFSCPIGKEKGVPLSVRDAL